MTPIKRQRSRAYPSETLPDCIQLATKIYEKYRSKDVFINLDDIGKLVGKSGKTVKSPVAACCHYGLLKNKVHTGYACTQLLIKIHRSFSEFEKVESIITALRTPKLYSELIEKYSKVELPTEEGLSIDLFRNFGLTDKASHKASEVFYSNLKYYKFINDNKINLNNSVGNLFNTPAAENEVSENNHLDVIVIDDLENNQDDENGKISSNGLNSSLEDSQEKSRNDENSNVDNVDVDEVIEFSNDIFLGFDKKRRVKRAKIVLQNNLNRQDIIRLEKMLKEFLEPYKI